VEQTRGPTADEQKPDRRRGGSGRAGRRPRSRGGQGAMRKSGGRVGKVMESYLGRLVISAALPTTTCRGLR
jgi:hypothetical protein